VHIFRRLQLNANPNVNETILGKFLAKIFNGYSRVVEYHNDIHAADALQMVYLMMTTGRLIEIA
jgi:hypothetical protein